MWILLVVLTLALIGQPVAAQRPSDIPLHARVRVALPDSARQAWFTPRQQWVHGELAAMAADTLYLKVQGTASAVAIPHNMIRRLDRSLGVPSLAASAVQGAAGGAVLGALYGVLLRSVEARSWRGHTTGEAALAGGGAGAGIGFVLGAIFPTERWRRIQLW